MMQTPAPALLDFVADLICPWCAIAHRHLDAALAVLAGEGVPITPVWRPFLLYADTPPGGFAQNEHLRRRFGSLAAAGRYHAGVAEAGRAVGFDFQYERITVTPSTVDAHRLLLLAATPEVQWRLADALARAFLEDGSDIAERAVLQRLAGSVGLDPGGVKAMLESDRFVDDVRASDLIAKRAGIRQVPAFCLHGRILHVANIDELADTLRTAHRVGPRVGSPGRKRADQDVSA